MVNKLSFTTLWLFILVFLNRTTIWKHNETFAFLIHKAFLICNMNTCVHIVIVYHIIFYVLRLFFYFRSIIIYYYLNFFLLKSNSIFSYKTIYFNVYYLNPNSDVPKIFFMHFKYRHKLSFRHNVDPLGIWLLN